MAGSNSSLEIIPSERDELNLMEDPRTGLLERQQEEDILRALSRFPGGKRRIFCSLGEHGKRVCSI
jgi:hypothetical protein